MTFRVLMADLRYRSRRLGTGLALLAVVGAVALAVRLDIVQVGFASGRAFRNSPLALYRLGVVVAQFGAFVFGPLAALLLLRDRERGWYRVLFACPISPASYFWGRFLGGVLTIAVLALGLIAGTSIGCALPGVDSVTVGQHAFLPWLAVLGLVVLPDLFVIVGLTFSVCAATARAAWAFVVPLLLFAFDLAMVTVADQRHSLLTAILEPFGSVAGALATEGWTVAEQNVRLVPLTQTLLINRLVWVGLAGLVIWFVGGHFRFDRYFSGSRELPNGREVPRRREQVVSGEGEILRGRGRWLASLPALAKGELRLLARRPEAFLVVGTALFFLHIDQAFGNSVMGAPIMPAAARLSRFEPLSYGLFVRIALVVFLGFSVARWRRPGLHELLSVTPAPTWLAMGSRALASSAVAAALAFLAIPTGLLVQIAAGVGRVDLNLYLRQIFLVEYPALLAFLGLAFFVFSVVPGHWARGASMLCGLWALVLALPRMGVEHPLLVFGSSPSYMHTDFNGYGPFAVGIGVLRLYWLALGTLLAFLGYLVWQRGTECWRRGCAAAVRRRFCAGWIAGGGSLLIVAAVTAGIVVLDSGELPTSATRDRAAARYELAFARYRGRPHPMIDHLDVGVELHPRDGRVEVVGSYSLRNTNSRPLRELLLSFHPGDRLSAAELEDSGRMRLEESSDHLGFRRYRLDPPLEVGEAVDLTFSVGRQTPTIPLDSSGFGALENGTLLGDDILPVLGYDDQREITDPAKRRRRGLDPREAHLDPERSFASADAGWVSFETRVTTDAGQIAFAPGELVGTGFAEGGRRRWFEYRSAVPVNRGLNWLSADYEITSERCAGPPSSRTPVVVEVAHLRGHESNVPRMIEAACATIAFSEPRFGPYPYPTLRIVEAPAYFQGAFALPGLVVMSESFGFRLRVEGADDPPFQVTAHEVAHQWWGHQVVPAAGPGARLVGETISQYVSSRVLEEVRGRDADRAFLRRQLRRYLLGRSRSAQIETPLVRVGADAYLHSGKGAVVMNGLQRLLGPEVLDRGLAAFLSQFRRSGPPFPIAGDLVRNLRASVRPAEARLIREALEEIVLYDHRLVSARAEPDPEGGWAIVVDARLGRLLADPAGNEREVPFVGPVDLELLGSAGTATAVRVEGASGSVRWRFVVPDLPVRVVLDPDLAYIDRNRADNSVAVELEAPRR